MADISQIKQGEEVYDIKDAEARTMASDLSKTLNNKMNIMQSYKSTTKIPKNIFIGTTAVSNLSADNFEDGDIYIYVDASST